MLEYLGDCTTHKTGTRAFKSGVYRCGDEYIALSKGEKFPPCETDYWLIVVSV